MEKRKLLNLGVALSVLLGLSVPMVANAQLAPAAGGTGSALTAPDAVGAGQDVLFRVVNPTGGVAQFTIPELGIAHSVPPFSERTFYVDMSNVMTRKFTYQVQGPGGQLLSSGDIINRDFFFPGAEADAVALTRMINYSTAYTAPIMPEPQYIDEIPAAAPVKPGVPVRGYW